MEQITERAQQFIAALGQVEAGAAGAVEEMAGLFADDAELHNPVLDRTSAALSGRGGAREFWEKYQQSFGQVRSEFYHVTTGDRTAGLFWKSAGQDATGAPVSYEGATLLHFADDGRISYFRGYYDTRTLSHEAGA